MIEHDINKFNNFIAGWYLDDTSICDKLIQYHKFSENKFEGICRTGVDKSVKESTDVYFHANDELIWDGYFSQLEKVINEYKTKYPMCEQGAFWGISENINIQHYKPSQGFHAYHTERNSPNNNRHLAFMTYLNDVTDGGETEFFHQGIKVRPEKGLTLIWGCDWTFTHRGIPSHTQEKYITTGWLSYIP
jgi:hypothetical protein